MSDFVLCVNNDDYDGSLTVGKAYRVIPDEGGEQHSMIRIVDDTGEDYLFEMNRFKALNLSGWNYHIIRRTYDTGGDPTATGEIYDIREVYYDETGTPILCSVESDYPIGADLEGLRGDFEEYRKAFDRPILDYSMFENQDS